MYVAPRDRWEAELIEIWENTLHLRPIGIHNNFFELGGDSKLIASLLVAIEKTYGRQFPLALLYEAPTIEQLAAILRQENWSVPRKSLVPIQPNGSRPPLFGIHVLGKGLKTYRSLLPYLGAEQPVYGLHYRLGVVPTERYTEALTTVPDLALTISKKCNSYNRKRLSFMRAFFRWFCRLRDGSTIARLRGAGRPPDSLRYHRSRLFQASFPRPTNPTALAERPTLGTNYITQKSAAKLTS